MDVDVGALWRTPGDQLIPFLDLLEHPEASNTPEGWLFGSGEPVADWNLGAVHSGSGSEERLREYVGRLQDRELPGLLMLSSAVAGKLEPVAKELGLEHAGAAPFMVSRPLGADADPAPYQIERVKDADALREAQVMLTEAFSIPLESNERVLGSHVLGRSDLAVYVARQGGVPMSTLTVSSSTGEVVGIWAMGTPPKHQRKGAGRALLQGVMAERAAAGAELFYLFATPAGKPLYDAIGFKTVDEAPTYVMGESTQYASH